MKKENVGQSIKVGFSADLLGLVFLVLKLTHVIDWKWIWVLCPFWISIAIGIVIVAVWLLAIYLILHKKSQR